MELQRYDIVKIEPKYTSGSVQGKCRPYVVISNKKSLENSNIFTAMPLTHIIKKLYLPVHGCIEANSDNGLSVYSMMLGEQPQTFDKEEIIERLGNVSNPQQRNMVNKVVYNSFFFGENIDWKEVFA